MNLPLELQSLPRDVLGIIFSMLSPMDLLRVSHLCRRFRALTHERCWSGTGMQKLQQWLKREYQDYYLPYNRLSYYDRDYTTGALSMTWPKRPLRIVNFVRPQAGGVYQKLDMDDVAFITSRLSEVFGTQFRPNRATNRNGPTYPVVVEWEGHQVHSRIQIDFSTEPVSLLPEESHTIGLIWAVWPADAFHYSHLIESVKVELLGDDLGNSNYEKEFDRRKNMRLLGGMRNLMVVRSFEELSIAQIYSLVRGDLVNNFPTLEEFESFLSRESIEKSRDALEALKGKSALGIDVPRTLQDDGSGDGGGGVISSITNMFRSGFPFGTLYD